MGAGTKIDELAVPVSSSFSAVWDLLLNKLNLERVGSKEPECFILCQNKSVEGLLLSDKLGSGLLNIFVVFRCEDIFGSSIAVVEES